MVIIDLSQVMLSNLMVHLNSHKNLEVQMDLFRHMCLNSIRAIRMKFASEYGEIIIACDNTKFWRRQIFPYYKANRKKDRDASIFDWHEIFKCLNQIKAELQTYFPYRVIQVDNAEADDVIATLVKNNQDEKILIVSGDKDFKQLHKFPNVQQFDPVGKRMITCEDPEGFLIDHIIHGDRGDGIPNIFSADDVFVSGQRQKRVTAQRLEALANKTPEEFGDPELTRNYYRNKLIIDLMEIPKEIQDSIMAKYSEEAGKNRSRLFGYFITYNLKNLMVDIGDF